MNLKRKDIGSDQMFEVCVMITNDIDSLHLCQTIQKFQSMDHHPADVCLPEVKQVAEDE
jgi:hypothetical protein